jgi:hypothetical protein
LTILGVLCNLYNKTFSLPENFIEKFQQVLHILPDLFRLSPEATNDVVQKPTTHLLWKVFGSVMWGTRVLQIPMYEYGNFIAWVSRRASLLASCPELWNCPCDIWPSAFEDLKGLILKILENHPRDLRSVHGKAVHEMYTDASDEGFGVVHCGPKLQGTYQGQWSVDMKVRIIAERELVALVRGVAFAREKFDGVEHIKSYQDNTTVISWVKKRRATTPFGNAVLKELFCLLGKTTLELVYVASDKNLADKPSREFGFPRL